MTSRNPDRLYYSKLRRKAQCFCVDLAHKEWCDLWHTHFDWDGLGNQGWLHRRRHLNALLIALAQARKELSSQPIPYQLFATVHPKSSTDDAIYVHTPNPNGSEFPYDFGYAAPVSSLPPLLAGLINSEHYKVLKASPNANSYFIIVAKGP